MPLDFISSEHPTTIVGLDPGSRNLGLAELVYESNGHITPTVTRAKVLDLGGKRASIVDQSRALVSVMYPYLVQKNTVIAVESQFRGTRNVMIQGIIVALCKAYAVPCVAYHAGEVKRGLGMQLLGHANNKKQVVKWAQEEFNKMNINLGICDADAPFKSDHVCDALALAVYCKKVIG